MVMPFLGLSNVEGSGQDSVRSLFPHILPMYFYSRLLDNLDSHMRVLFLFGVLQNIVH